MRSRITFSQLLACLTGLVGWQARPTDAFAQANGWSAELRGGVTGRPLLSGTYLLRLRAGGLEVQTKATLVR
ncbi:MAG: hypothetical protein RBT60_10685 [Candidatus Krumholzibacteria bacterium]|jgi:hypothetical protein|nr:hypothetical protein [Candidatus Krumholzibacteria bacterium]